ncbi:WD40/YVTN repeat-like-containing domain,Integrin-alpha FG-GAP repeat-containing protein 2 [Cinara cedri]|uniref:WD40/YVTN repeat-like-containing domain,Integrin-alpha FG-GAP repeat-containing protein 2 n=1 Tax=Cinara cedri TaxID=506608 RepID=A0A5E4LYC4_9HEMI|nr:WD40/YVTN repeat-like-containing domain,Integrin-alpha FG-GAP repeat-containing protein 2 [Cinara cedri]
MAEEIKLASFVDHCDFEVSGTIFKSAVALGDVDNDNDVELVVGNMEGSVYIFKNRQQIQKISGLGIITGLAIGDLMNCGSNTLVVVSGDGWCHIYLCLNLNKSDSSNECTAKLESVHIQRIPANTKVILLGDIDADGLIELVVGLTDRVVRTYRWSQNATSGRLVPLHKWECIDQIGSIILTKDSEDRPCLLVSQPGLTALCIYCPIAFPELSEKTIVYEQSTELRDIYISSEMVGDLSVSRNSEQRRVNTVSDLYAISTLDGLLMLAQGETILRTVKLDQEVFSINKLPVGNGRPDYIITCAWNGEILIVDQKCEVLATFKLGEPITAFCSGMYTVKPNTKPVYCLVFITVKNKVHVYFNMKLPNTCTESLSNCIKQEKQLSEMINLFDGPMKKKLINACLYHYNFNNK